MKRVYTLYRVSSKGQVIENDIPMQKQAAREFADRNGWVIVKEFYEKGISGYKVSADNRDAIQDLKAAAERKEFDILLVYMFDRLGRKQNETPFVVEWFVGQGIEVWSTQEGQQRFENDVDYLMNYMRFWQANGESRKTSTRVKTRIRQLTAEGVYTGGVTPFGYTLVKSGKCNKKGKELMDIEIDEAEAAVVRMIFEKTVREGFGSYRMADYLNGLGIKTHNGSRFQCNTINRILRNRMYCGYFIAGDVESPHIERIQIIEESLFFQAQYILDQRANTEKEKQQIARTTKGKTLLSGNLYCAHCGSKLVLTTSSGRRAKGEPKRETHIRYACHYKIRHPQDCDGQTGYSGEKLDGIVDNIVMQLFERMTTALRSQLIQKQREKELQLTNSSVANLEKLHAATE